MRFRKVGIAAAVGAVAVASAAFTGSSASASVGISGGPGHGPCWPTVAATGMGSQGTPWILKGKYDLDAPVGVIVGEQFLIEAAPGQVWHVTLADNGVVFFDKVLTAGPTGLVAMGSTPVHGTGSQRLTADGTDLGDGETIDASVTLPAMPNPCGHVG